MVKKSLLGKIRNIKSVYDFFLMKKEILGELKDESLKEKLKNIDSPVDFFAYKKIIEKSLRGE